MSGRKLDPVWVSFNKTNVKNEVRAIRKTCGKYMHPLVAQMKKHLEDDCSENLEDVDNGMYFIFISGVTININKFIKT